MLAEILGVPLRTCDAALAGASGHSATVEVLSRTARLYEASCWTLTLANAEGWDFDEPCRKALAWLGDKRDNPRAAMGPELGLDLLFVAHTRSSLPSLVIPPVFMSILADLGAGIVVDGMLTAADEGSE